MNWDDVKIFLAVARAGQFLGAARRLGLNHATVSRRISALEAAVKAPLFDRTTSGVQLTAVGEAFLPAAEGMEAGFIAARAAVPEAGDRVSGTVRIGAPDGFGVAFLAPRLGPLAEANPDLALQLVPVPRSFSLSRREADIAITVERPAEGRLVAGKLVDYTLGPYASKTYAAQNGLPRSRESLSEHRLVGYVDDLVIHPTLAYAPEIDPDWQARFCVSSAMGQVEAVRSGAGIGILHTFIARTFDDLVPVSALPTIHRAYWLVYHESMRPLRRIRTVARYIAEAVEKEHGIFRDDIHSTG